MNLTKNMVWLATILCGLFAVQGLAQVPHDPQSPQDYVAPASVGGGNVVSPLNIDVVNANNIAVAKTLNANVLDTNAIVDFGPLNVAGTTTAQTINANQVTATGFVDSGNANIMGNLNVTGNANVNGNLGVVGNANFIGDIAANGNVTFDANARLYSPTLGVMRLTKADGSNTTGTDGYAIGPMSTSGVRFTQQTGVGGRGAVRLGDNSGYAAMLSAGFIYTSTGSVLSDVNGNNAINMGSGTFNMSSGPSGTTTVLAGGANGNITVPIGLNIGTANVNPPTGGLTYQGPATHSEYLTHNGNTAITGALSGASVATALIPAGSIVIGVTTRVITNVTGTGVTAFTIGDGTTAAAYGTQSTLTANATTTNSNWTLTSAPIYTSATNIVLTAVGGTFSGGTVRISVFYITCSPPGS